MCTSVFMLVMHVGEVGMSMSDRRMPMPVRMLSARGYGKIVSMLMMVVMHVFMLMLHFTVRMFVRVMFGQMEPYSQGHQCASDDQYRRHRIAQHHRQHSAVKMPSAFSSREAPEAGIPFRPSISNTGPTIPPLATASANHIASRRTSLADLAFVSSRYSVRARPEPRYNSPANIHGLISASRSLASGVLAPNKMAAPKAARTPVWRK